MKKNKSEKTAEEKDREERRNKEKAFSSEVGKKIKAILNERNINNVGLINKLQNLSCETNKSKAQVSRYLRGESSMNLLFLKELCQTLGISSDYILGIDEHGIDRETVTPFIVLSNLALLLKQFGFKIEFNSDYSKVMLTTDNKHMISFLFLGRIDRLYTMDQIDHFCQSLDLVMHGDSFKTKDEYNSYYKKLFVNRETEKAYKDFNELSLDMEEILRPVKEEIDEKFECEITYVTLAPEEVYSLQWDTFSSEKRENIIKELENE